jgi:medium-chain acyl-[acyl-carrier-protein] hydrolase
MILFCIPYAGGGAEAFHGWPEALAPSINVQIATLPGRGMHLGEPLIDTISGIVSKLAGQCSTWGNQPYAILGYSFGAVVGYALTLHMEAQGAKPQHLFVGGARSPLLPAMRPPFHPLPDAVLIEELRAINGTPPEVLANSEMMSLFLPVIRSDFKALETFSATPQRVSCPLSIFGGTTDPFVPLDDRACWAELTSSDEVNQVSFPGDHFILMSQRAAICRFVRSTLLWASKIQGLVHVSEELRQ